VETPFKLKGKRSYALNRLQFPDIYGIRYSRISETDVGILWLWKVSVADQLDSLVGIGASALSY